jgi:hypothetical protein
MNEQEITSHIQNLIALRSSCKTAEERDAINQRLYELASKLVKNNNEIKA